MRLHAKILVMMAPLFAAGFALALLLSRQAIGPVLRAEVGERAASAVLEHGSPLAHGIAAKDERLLLPVLLGLSSRLRADYVIALDREGRVVAHTNVMERGRVLSDPVSRFDMALEAPGHTVLPGGSTLDVGVPIRAEAEDYLLAGRAGGRRRVGTVRLGMSLARVQAAQRRIERRLSGAVALAAGSVLVIALWALRRFLAPLHDLVRAFRLVGAGDRDVRVEVSSRDELGELAASFNGMSEDLAETTVSRDYLDRLFDGLPDIMLVVDSEWRVRSVNRDALEALGFTEAELLMRPVSGLFRGAPGGAPLDAMERRALERDGAVKGVELVMLRRGGEPVPVLVSASLLKGAADGRTEMAIVAKDLSERKRWEAELLGAKSMLEATIEATADGILVVDAGGRFVRHNKRFAEMWRIPEEVLRAGDDKAAREGASAQVKDPAAFLARVAEIYADPRKRCMDLVELKDGRVFERYTQPQEVDGRVAGRVWDFRDVTERRRLEAMVVQAEKLSAVGQLAAGVAHEVNNPLGIILGFAQSAARRVPEGDPLRLAVTSIEREALRCKTLVQDLLTFSRQNKGRMERVGLAEAVRGSLSFIGARAKVKGVEVETDLADSGAVMADKNQLQQVVVNLCNNAVDAMEKGGRMTIRTRTASLEDGRWAALEVSDTGAGIPPEVLPRVFDPFFTTKGVGQGTGLGLSLVYEIVRRHGGAIDVETAVGEGTTFRVRLPPAPSA